MKRELSKVKMAGRYCLKNRLSFVEFLLIQRGEERRGEVMRYSFIWRDVFFLQKDQLGAASLQRREEERKDEDRGKSHSNNCHSCSVWLKVEGRGRWAAYSSRNMSLDSPPIVVCMCLSRTQLVRFMTVEGSY